MLTETTSPALPHDPDSDPVTTWFEACCAFAAGAHGSPVCAACGWLADDHGPDAEVRVLPVRRAVRRPRRLAS